MQTTNTRRLIGGSRNADLQLICLTKMKYKITQWGCCARSDDVGQKNLNLLQL